MDLTRREAIIRMAILMGATTLSPRLLADKLGTASAAAGSPAFDPALLDEIADTIIPTTDVPGAKAAGVGAFIAMMLRDCYPAEQQTAVRDGLRQLTTDFAARHGTAFVSAPAADRTTFLTELERGRPPYFRILKELTLLGYFTSEIGCTQAFQYVEVPGRYDGDVLIKPGDRDWTREIK